MGGAEQVWLSALCWLTVCLQASPGRQLVCLFLSTFDSYVVSSQRTLPASLCEEGRADRRSAMTMDVRRRVASEGTYSEETPVKPPPKRSFDVAFLMAPDDGPKRRSLVASPVLYPEEPAQECPRSAFTKVAKEDSPVAQEYPSPSSPGFPQRPFPQDSPERLAKRFPEVVPYGTLMYPFPAVLPPTPPALLTATAALLPSSLAALTLPAQNVCAKCNISFRMTSDLVYHMRSQHKSDHAGGDSSRRRREQDKLRCPVCNESFRERHHLTRHMTAHQDKDGDKDTDEEELCVRRRMTK